MINKIPHLNIIDKYTLRAFEIVEPRECWFELSFFETGEFEVYARASKKNLAALKKGNYVTIPNKRFIWVITSIRKLYNADGVPMVIAKGYEAKYLLKKGNIDMPLQLPNTLSAAVVNLINTYLIPYVDYLSYELINIDIELVDTQAPRGNLLEFVNNLLRQYNCGSQVIYDKEQGLLKFKILQGTDKSKSIKFSPSLDNLLTSEFLSDDKDVATRAIVVCKVNDIEFTEIYDTGAVGIDRSAITVNSNLSTKYLDANGEEKELDLTNAADLRLFKSWLREEGKAELEKHKTLEEVTAEIDFTNSKYKFNNDYYLGDIVGIQDEYFKSTLKPRILKYTFRQDASGKYTENADYGE